MAIDGWNDDEITAWGEKTGRNPTDRGKAGVKRSILTDQNGIPLGFVMDGASRHDVKLARATLESIPIARPEIKAYHRQHLCLDAGYMGFVLTQVIWGMTSRTLPPSLGTRFM